MIKRRLSHETNAHRLPAAGRTDPVPATRIPHARFCKGDPNHPEKRRLFRLRKVLELLDAGSCKRKKQACQGRRQGRLRRHEDHQQPSCRQQLGAVCQLPAGQDLHHVLRCPNGERNRRNRLLPGTCHLRQSGYQPGRAGQLLGVRHHRLADRDLYFHNHQQSGSGQRRRPALVFHRDGIC